MRRTALIVNPLLLLSLLMLGLLGIPGASASRGEIPRAVPTFFLTPTPGPDGKIIYEVQPGDSLWRIAAIANISIEQLMALNGIQPNDVISIGMKLLLGTGGPVIATEEGPSELLTATPIPPTPTPIFGIGEICVLLYIDANGDARLQEGEAPLAAGEVSVADVSGVVAGEHTTGTDPEGYCFTDLENNDYNVSVAVPPEYNPTTAMNIPVRLAPGDIKYVQFGAQPSAANNTQPPSGGNNRSTLLGGLGVVLLLAAGGLAYYASRLYGTSKYTPH